MGNPAVPKTIIEGRRGHEWGRRCVKMKGTQESSEGVQGGICTDIHNEKNKICIIYLKTLHYTDVTTYALASSLDVALIVLM